MKEFISYIFNRQDAESFLSFGKNKMDLVAMKIVRCRRDRVFLNFKNTTKALAVQWANADQTFRIAVDSQNKDF